MELINRYVFAVTKRLPESQREDIERELKTIIEDMMDEYGEEEPKEARVKKVLLELGDPALLADNYRGSKRYLIGPEHYDNYITVLKIVFSAIFIGMSVAVVVANIVSFEGSLLNVIIEYTATLFSALMQGLAWVTISFGIAEYYGTKELNKKKENKGWDLSELPQIPAKEAIISKWELLFAVIFSTIFTIVFCFTPQVIAVYISRAAGTTIIPVFNVEAILGYRILFIITLIIGIIKEVLKFISGRWTFKLSIADSLISIISMALALIIFSNPNIWNGSFPIEIAKVFPEAGVDFVKIWDGARKGILLAIIIFTGMDVASVMYKGIKYKK
ncbi:hypothetical protein [Clostridium sp.]|uniref:hypothetical protein n=1 Tax=Clostridium sp. TaxID=1506 RepID=UPI002FC64ECC